MLHSNYTIYLYKISVSFSNFFVFFSSDSHRHTDQMICLYGWIGLYMNVNLSNLNKGKQYLIYQTGLVIAILPS